MKTTHHEGKYGAIQICMNGHVHIQFGIATIHLSMTQFRAFLEAAKEGLEEFEEITENGSKNEWRQAQVAH